MLIIFTSVVWIILFEILFFFLYKISKNRKFLKLPFTLYPFNPDSYFKIAIYGGSAAAGYNSSLNFSTILMHELKNFKNKNIFLMNYASNSMPFHNGQHELAKEFIEHYDLSVVYSGNNEDQISLQEFWDSSRSKYLTMVKSYNHKCRRKMTFTYRFFFYVISISYFFTFIYKLIRRILNFFKNLKRFLPKRSYNNKQYQVIKNIEPVTKEPILSEKERGLNYTNYFSDIEELSSLANKKNKVLFISVVNNCLFSPTQCLGKTINKKEIDDILNTLNNIKVELQKNPKQIKYFLEILTNLENNYKDNAFIDHLSGILKLMQKDESGFDNLNSAFDRDFPIIGRSNNYKNCMVKKICSNYKYSDFLDIEKYFQSILLQNSEDYRKLFSDVQHPSSFGHIILGYSIVEFLKNVDSNLNDFKFLKNIQKKYFSILKKDLYFEKKDFFMKFRWFLSCTRGVSQKNEYLDEAKKNLKKWWEISKNDTCKSEYFFWEAIISALRNDHDDIKFFLHRSKIINPKTSIKLKKQVGSNGISWGKILQEVLEEKI